jgi:hypothetical protein
MYVIQVRRWRKFQSQLGGEYLFQMKKKREREGEKRKAEFNSSPSCRARSP